MLRPSGRSRIGLLVLSALLSGCSLIGRATPPAADLTGSYEGVLRVEGDDLSGDLVLSQDGGRIDATLTTDVGFTARGSGKLEGTVMRLRLEYGEECMGRMELAGQAIEAGQRLAGTVEVQDCTGPANGSYSFARR